MIQHITAEQLKEWMDKDEVILIDVREPAEYKAEHIPSAISIPLTQIELNNLPKHVDKKLVFQCYSGKRGSLACKKIVSANTACDVYNLIGGIMSWTQSGYEVSVSRKFFLPLDRQVQLTIGIGIFLGSLLAYAVHPAFLLLTGFLGLGLIFAGLTGFCGLAQLMTRMPWNKVTPNRVPPSVCGI